ncbi:MAG TPA: hypothetical protein DIT19_03015 [Desulfonauticus sp.]|nr:MAG: hypothetical protein XD41_2147 [Desulfonauticus sp. 38_4375]HCO12178.1 hypothetical protein [Desulfonauticus sp.]
MGYLLIVGPKLKDRDFEIREKYREKIREKLSHLGIVLQEYVWIWDRKNWLKLVVGKYEKAEDSVYLQRFLQKNGFKTEFLENPDWEK